MECLDGLYYWIKDIWVIMMNGYEIRMLGYILAGIDIETKGL